MGTSFTSKSISVSALALTLWLSPANTHAQLSDEARFDMLSGRVELADGDEDWPLVLETIIELNDIERDEPLPPMLSFFEGKALLRAGQAYAALAPLADYIERAGSEGEVYHKALAFYDEADRDPATRQHRAEEAVEQQAVIDRRNAELNQLPDFETLAETGTPVGSSFHDCEDCPEMVVLPAGEFSMGSRRSEYGRDSDEGPVRTVPLASSFAVGKYEISVGEFERFVDDARYRMSEGCQTWADNVWTDERSVTWQDPGHIQTANHPVTCVSWDDAQAYVDWLSDHTGERYRLLSEAEWEYAARAGSDHAWSGNNDWDCQLGNVADDAFSDEVGSDNEDRAECDDDHYSPAPVGSFAPNAFGLFDLHGNVWEWTLDCWANDYRRAPDNGGARRNGDCTRRVQRGGSWLDTPQVSRSANRSSIGLTTKTSSIGIRIAREIDENIVE